jgi:hypothetical protein
VVRGHGNAPAPSLTPIANIPGKERQRSRGTVVLQLLAGGKQQI